MSIGGGGREIITFSFFHFQRESILCWPAAAAITHTHTHTYAHTKGKAHLHRRTDTYTYILTIGKTYFTQIIHNLYSNTHFMKIQFVTHIEMRNIFDFLHNPFYRPKIQFNNFTRTPEN